MANEQLQAMLDNIDELSRENMTPANFLGVKRPDARAVLREFFYNHPFYPVIKLPYQVQTVKFDNTIPVDVTLPNGTIFVQFYRSLAGNIAVNFEGNAPDPTTLVANVIVEGVVINPPQTVGYFVYGKGQISVRGEANSILTIVSYTGEDGQIG